MAKEDAKIGLGESSYPKILCKRHARMTQYETSHLAACIFARKRVEQRAGELSAVEILACLLHPLRTQLLLGRTVPIRNELNRWGFQVNDQLRPQGQHYLTESQYVCEGILKSIRT